MPLQPKFLDHANAQMLLIGHQGNALEKAADKEVTGQDQGKDKPIEEIEKLEDEDQIRIEHLRGLLDPLFRTYERNMLTAVEKRMTLYSWTLVSALRNIQSFKPHGRAARLRHIQMTASTTLYVALNHCCRASLGFGKGAMSPLLRICT